MKKNIVIVGAGINGVTIARKLAKEGSYNIKLIDEERGCGYHASTRNSGVIHAGFYYSPKTTKAKMCANGNKRLREYCTENKLMVNRCGKVVVSSNEEQSNILEELYARGIENGCSIELKEAQKLKEYEPTAKSIKHFLWSPNTWSASPLEIMRCLEKECEELGVEFKLKSKMIGLDSNKIYIENQAAINYDYLINASGGSTLKIYRMLVQEEELEMLPFKGLYLKSKKPRGECKTHIYPVPNIKNPFLGIHTTITVDKFLKLGPTAIPALAWNNYKGLQNIDHNSIRIMTNFARCIIRNDFNMRSLAFNEFKNYLKVNIIKKLRK